MVEDKSLKDNMYGLDIHNTVFVVDSPATVFMVAILSRGLPINLVVEKKKGLETEKASVLLHNFVKAAITIKSIRTVELPHRFFIKAWEIKKILRIRKETRDLYTQYSSKTVFVGPPTSTFMRSLRCEKKNIIYTYHGLTDLFEREKIYERRQTIKSKMQDFIIGNIIGLPNSTWCHFWPDNAFSLCDLNNDREVFLDVYDFHSDYIEKVFEKFSKYNDDKNNILFLPIFEVHNKNGISSDTASYDRLNCQFLLSHIDKSEDRVFIKYHPWLYRANDNIRDSLSIKLMEQGIEAYDIAEMMPDDIGGVMIPTEVYCRYFTFKKIISQDSSTMWYLTHNTEIEKIIDLRYSNASYKQEMIECITYIKKKRDKDDIKYYLE